MVKMLQLMSSSRSIIPSSCQWAGIRSLFLTGRISFMDLDRNSSVIYVGITVTESVGILSGILRNGTISMVCVASAFPIPKTSMKSHQLRKKKQVVMAKIKQLRDDLKDIDIEIDSLMEELKAVSEKRVSLRSLWLVSPCYLTVSYSCISGGPLLHGLHDHL